MIKYKEINHLALVTSDMDRTIRFWRDLLELKLVGGVSKRGNRQYFFQISESCLIAFFEWQNVNPCKEKEAGSPGEECISFDHVCLEVETADVLWLLKDRLDAAGIWVSEVIDNGFIHSIFTNDPNGICVELCYRVPDVDMSQDLHIVDSTPSAVTLQGRNPQSFWPEVKNPTSLSERKVYHGELSIIVSGEDALPSV
ncbi:MAG: VOC family protein [Nitrospirae bacterium]|nr:VOC family protein [Nitrospirota bacterium]